MFEDSYRKLSTRNILFSEEQMESLRIFRIYNSFGNPDLITFDFIYTYFENCCGKTRYGLIDVADRGKTMRKVSIIVFDDAWSRNIYALTNWEYSSDSFELLELYN